MIRGPVLPQSRESLWSLVSGRLDSIERGLTLVLEGLDCSNGQLGVVDALARDAAGAPVLVMLAHDADPLVLARAMSALDFLRRVGDSLAQAVPEAEFFAGSQGRVVVVGSDHSVATLEQLARQPLPSLHLCRLEPFRLAGSERFAVRWFNRPMPAMANATSSSASMSPPSATEVVPEFVVPPADEKVWRTLHDFCHRIDPDVRLDGDRYRRRITWHGHLLGELQVVAGSLVAVHSEGTSALATPLDLRSFSDRLVRTFAQRAGLTIERPNADAADTAVDRDAAPRHAVHGRNGTVARSDGLRSVVAAARLSPEEYSALGSPTSAVGGEADGAATADDVARIVAAQEGSWAPRGRTD